MKFILRKVKKNEILYFAFFIHYPSGSSRDEGLFP